MATITERLNVGYDGINSSSDIVQDLNDYKQDIKEFFEEHRSEFIITLHHEQSPDFGCCLYYLEIEMPEDLKVPFQKTFL